MGLPVERLLEVFEILNTISVRLTLLLRCSAGVGSFLCCYLGTPQPGIPERHLHIWMCLLEKDV